ncbi:MAG: glycoside hydrolase family 2 protein [Chitinophagaceae bacterium]
MRNFSLILALLLLAVRGIALDQPSGVRSIVPFNENWQFKKAAYNQAVKWLDAPWETVSVPHTWNALDMQTNKNFYQGDAFYKKSFNTDPAWKNKRVLLRFEGVGSKTEVYLNEKLVGTHKGGYSAFVCELTYALNPQGENELIVKANNETSEEVIPINHNLFGVYGGIYRPVTLIAVDKISFTPTDYASPGVFIRQQNVSASNADLTITAKIDNKTGLAQQAELETTLYDALGNAVKSVKKNVVFLSQGMQVFTQELSVKKPHLWDGLKDPYLYKAVTTISYNGKLADRMELPVGIRKFEIVGGEGLLLNGKPYRLKGVCRHQDWWGYGSALTNAQHAADLETIREMGANSIRLAHYQQSEYLYSKADSMGLIIWAEIPFVNASSGKEGDNAKQQLTELIRQNYHHPSIYVWGLHNEVYAKSPADHVPSLTAELHALAKKEDPDRYTVSVNGYGSMERSENQLADIQGMNRYYGWYEGKTADLEKWITGLKAQYPQHKVMLSEYGAEGNPDQQDENPPVRFDPVSGKYFPEQMQTRYHEIQWGIIEKNPYLAASYIWNMFDFAVPLWNRGGVPARNMKGLVSFDRKIKKDAFYWYKANWSEEPVLYISDRRLNKRKQAVTNITVYSNTGTPSLYINGKKTDKPKQGNTGVHYIFERVELKKGANTVEVKTTLNEKHFTDSVTWELL